MDWTAGGVAGALGVLQGREVALRIQGGGAARAGGGDGLAVDVVHQVTAGEDAGQVRPRRGASTRM